MNNNDKSPPKEVIIEPINYEFLNGLRGFGALAVYLQHFVNIYKYGHGEEDNYNTEFP